MFGGNLNALSYCPFFKHKNKLFEEHDNKHNIIMIDTQFKFDISISYVPYKDKPTHYGAMLFRKENITPSEMLGMVKDGFSYMAVLNDYDIKEIENRFYQSRTANDVKQTNFIGVDVDDSEIEFSDYISTISLKPTFAYTTANDGINGNRYRLVYIVNEPIKEQSEFSSYYNGIISTLNEQTNTINNDDCGAKIERLFNGNAKENIKTFESGLIYSKNDLPKGENSLHVSVKQVVKPRKRNKVISNVQNDFFSMDFEDFYLKYEKAFEIITQSKIYYQNGYALLDKNYKELKRFDKSGIITERRKKGVGEGRKKALYTWLMKKKQIKPTITKDELLFNAVFEICRFIDNRDGKLTKSYIMEVVNNVFDGECTMIQDENKRQFKVDKKWCSKNGFSANQYKNVIRKKLHFEEIGGWYDVSVSVGKNLKFAKENGIKVCRNTLKNFCKENGINPKGEELKEEIKNNIAMDELIQNKAKISVILSDTKVDGTMHQPMQENAIQRKIRHIQYMPNDKLTNYINSTKNTMYFVSYSMAMKQAI